MISIDLNKKIRITPNVKGNFSLSIIDNGKNEMIDLIDDFNYPVDIPITYYLDLSFNVFNNDTNEAFSFNMPKFNTVVIDIRSKALGDQIAWMPIIDLFQKKHNCKVVVRAHFNKLFSPYYCNLDIRGTEPFKMNAEAVYSVGYAVNGVDDSEGNIISPVDCRSISLQEVACYQLGIEPQEVRPYFSSNKPTIIEGKYVCITTCATAALKLWHNKKGFQEVVDYFNSQGYKVIDLGVTTDGLKGTISMNGILEWQKLINILEHSSMFFGNDNGLTWLAWACGVKVVTVSNFTSDNAVFKHTKINNKNVCNSCFNDVNLVFDNKDAMYCPRKKNFECSSSITGENVINEIKKVL